MEYKVAIVVVMAIAGLLILASCRGEGMTGGAVREQRLTNQEPPAAREPGLADFLSVLEKNPDFQEYRQAYPDYALKSQERLSPEVIQQKVNALRDGPHEAFIKTYEGLPASGSLYEVRFGDRKTRNELVAIISLKTATVHQIYLWVRVDAGARA